MKAKLMAKRIHNMWILADLLARRQIHNEENKRRKEVIIRRVRGNEVPEWIRAKFR